MILNSLVLNEIDAPKPGAAHTPKALGQLMHCRKPLATELNGILPQNLTHRVSQGAIQCQEQPRSRHHFRATPPAGVGARSL